MPDVIVCKLSGIPKVLIQPASPDGAAARAVDSSQAAADAIVLNADATSAGSSGSAATVDTASNDAARQQQHLLYEDEEETVFRLINETIGVHIYILQGFQTYRAPRVMKNAIGDPVFVAWTHDSSHNDGTAVEHLAATFDADTGFLEDASVDTIVLDCSHAEDIEAQEVLDRYDSQVQLLYATTAGVLLGGQDAEGERFVPTDKELEECIDDAAGEVGADVGAAAAGLAFNQGDEVDATNVSHGASPSPPSLTIPAALLDECGCSAPENVLMSSAVTPYFQYPRCGCYVAQCAVGSLVADALQWLTKADVTMVNAGGLRQSLPAGNITHGDILKVLPFLTEVTRFEHVTGATIRMMLKHSLASC